MKRALGPSVHDVKGAQQQQQQQLADFISSDDYVFVARLRDDDDDDDDESQNLEARFRSLALEYSDRYSFGVAGSAEPSGIWCYNNVDGSQHMASDLDQAGSLKNLVDVCTAELIPQLTRRNEMTHLSVRKPWPPVSPMLERPTSILTVVPVEAVLGLLPHQRRGRP